MASILREIVVDCTDPGLVSGFWGAVLGWEVREEEAFSWLAAPGRTRTETSRSSSSRCPSRRW